MNHGIRPAAFAWVALFSCLSLAEQKSPWKPLQLESAKLDGGTLYYEKSLVARLDFVRRCCKKLLAEKPEDTKRGEERLKKSQEVVADMNRILGVSVEGARMGRQQRALESLLRPRFRFADPEGKFRLYLVTKETIKNYLRQGGHLPNFTYDRATDTARYNFSTRFSVSVSEEAPKDFASATRVPIEELALPVTSADTIEEEAGDQAIKGHWALLKDRGLDKPQIVLQKLFLEYALKCRNLNKAHETAEEVLKVEPDFVPALAAPMHRLDTSGKLSEAKEVARRILELEKNQDSPLYKLAEQFLASEAEE